MVSVMSSQTIQNASDIPYTNADESYLLLRTELERFLSCLEMLGDDDWSKPTACTAWSIRDMVAHQAGGYASGTGYGEMFRQYRRKPKQGQLPEDAVNEFQLEERAEKSAAELIAELRQVGPAAIQKWAYQFRLAKLIAIPHQVAGMLSLRHLMWVIHSRDTWMHRLDICRAANLPFHQTVEHDGRIVELVMRDTAKALSSKLNGRAITVILTGIAGGKWKIGSGESVATLEMDVLDFNVWVSGRFSYEEGLSHANVTGDRGLVETAFKDLLILY
jgi:uncharacterized protein (TIGR03083 family)